MRMRSFLAAGACLLSVALGASAAQSAIIVTLDSVTQVSNGYLYTYDLTLANGSGLSTAAPSGLNSNSYGSSLTIFDFAGYVANTVTVNSFATATTGGNLTPSTSLTTSGLLMNPSDSDDPSVTNLNFSYTGGNYDTATDLALGTVSAVSIYSNTRATSYSGIDVKSANGNAEFFTTTTRGPVGEVPEVATWAMMVIGFGAIGSTLRSRRSAPAFVTFD